MSNRVFKVKHRVTKNYWNGYGSAFGLKGKTFKSALVAAKQVNLTHIRSAIKTERLINQVYIEEVHPEDHQKVLSIIHPDEALAVVKVHDFIKAKYGYPFLCMWMKIVSEDQYEGGKYLVKVTKDYKEFRERLKDLGYSSRHYTKLKDWVLIYDDDVAMRIKLLDGYDEFIVVKSILEDMK